MPFAWTGIYLNSILHGASNIDKEKDKSSERDAATCDQASVSGANSLGNRFPRFKS